MTRGRRSGAAAGVASGVTAGVAAGVATPPEAFEPAWLGAQLRTLLGALRGRRLCVAFSGGLDSSALLAALAALRRSERFSLRALHVNHQLHPGAAALAATAAARARALRVPCQIVKVRVERIRGESLEALARTARYRALAARLGHGELLLTAHHQEDQLETVLLALLRGSGVRGLAAMSLLTPWADTLLLRPLLGVSRSQLQRYAQARGLKWSEDPSNRDERFDRNYLRLRVLPLLQQRWPAAATTVARSAVQLAEARDLLEQLARDSLRHARDGAALRVSVLRGWALPQRRNALRCWIRERGLTPPDHRRLREIAGPMLAAKNDALPRVSWRGGELRRHADRLYAFVGSAPAAFEAIERWDWQAQPWLALSGGSELGLVRDRHGDVRLAALPRHLGVRFRHGGERLPSAHGHLALKDLLQTQGLAPWERAMVPLIMHRQRIIAVAELWVDPDYRVDDGGNAHRGRFRWRRRNSQPASW